VIGKGRKLIIVDKEITPSTIKDVIALAWTTHKSNIADINRLIEIYCGTQNKQNNLDGNYKPDLTQGMVVNRNYATVRTIVGYTYSQGAQITQRKGKYLEDIEKLIDVMSYENSDTVDGEAGNFASICGMAYFGTFPTNKLYSDYMPDYPIVPIALDPRTTFVVCSPEPGNPVRLSVTYFSSKEKNKTTFYCYTEDETYTIECDGQDNYNNSCRIVDYDINPIELNPIQLVKNNQFMQGDFELALDVSEALNLLATDSIVDVDNVIKSLLIIMNAELDGKEAEKARKNRILQLIGQPGMNVDAKFIYQQLDSNGMQNLREYFEEAYKEIVGTPDRKTRGGGGGDTGDAVKLRDGWADIEIVARTKEKYFKLAKKKQLAVAIKILKLLGLVSRDFKLEDVDVKLPRNKNDNIQTKAQSFSTLMATEEIAPEDALAMADMTTDITGVVSRGKKYKQELRTQEQNQGINKTKTKSTQVVEEVGVV
jgi:SPP1 family phage portal protein